IEAASRKTTCLTSANSRRPQMRETRTYNRLERRFWREIFAAEDINAYLREITILSNKNAQPLEEHLSRAIRETAVIEMLASQNENNLCKRSLMMIRSLTHDSSSASRLSAVYEDMFARHFGLETRLIASAGKVNKHNAAWLVLTGLNAIQLANIEQGTHLFLKDGRNLCPIQIKVFAIREDQRPREAIREQLKQARRWLLGLSETNVSPGGHPWPLDPVVRIYIEDKVGIPMASIDLRSGLST